MTVYFLPYDQINRKQDGQIISPVYIYLFIASSGFGLLDQLGVAEQLRRLTRAVLLYHLEVRKDVSSQEGTKLKKNSEPFIEFHRSLMLTQLVRS